MRKGKKKLVGKLGNLSSVTAQQIERHRESFSRCLAINSDKFYTKIFGRPLHGAITSTIVKYI